MTPNDQGLLYRFKSLIHAIEFFSQRFDVEQIVHFAADFMEELILIDRMVLLVKEGNKYIPIRQRGYDHVEYAMPVKTAYEDSVMLHAGLFMKDDLRRLFHEDLSLYYPASIGIPLVMDKKLYGLLLIDRFEKEPSFDYDDQIIAMALMNLYYNALTNYKWFFEIEQVKKELDDKIFSLFAINHSSKILLSTLDLTQVCSLSVSVFSEMTQSGKTAIYLYDPNSEKYRLEAYNNVFDTDQSFPILTAFQSEAVDKLTRCTCYDATAMDQRQVFTAAFFNGEAILEAMEGQLIIPVNKDNHLLGFVCLGRRVNGLAYPSTLYELIESLASSLYISVTNSRYYETIVYQKDLISQKVNELSGLNLMIRNINTSSTIETLTEMIQLTLHYQFDLKCGFVAQYDQESQFELLTNIGCQDMNRSLRLPRDVMSQLRAGKIVTAPSIDETDHILGKDVTRYIKGLYSGLVLIPIYTKLDEIKLLGIMAILDVAGKLVVDETSLLIFETMATAVGPVWSKLMDMEELIQENRLPAREKFLKMLGKEIQEADCFSMPLYVSHLYCNNRKLFHETPEFDRLQVAFKKTYRLDDHNLLIMTASPPEFEELKGRLNDGYVHIYEYKKDFGSTETFIEVVHNRHNG